MRTLYRCQSVTEYSGWNLVHLLASSDNVKSHNQFNTGKPSGLVELTITEPDLMTYFKPGDSYYVDFTRTRGIL